MLMDNQKILRQVLHAFVWLLLLSIPLVFPPDMEALTGTSMPPVARWIIMAGFLPFIGFFYLNYYVLIPKLWQRHNHWFYFLVVLLSCFLIQLFNVEFRQVTLSYYSVVVAVKPTLALRTYGGFLIFFSFWVASSILWLLAERQRAVARLQESENRRMKAELAQLKGQLNPHFLFNTLNGIYSLTLSQDKRAPEAVLKLAGLLDYVLLNRAQQFVLLQQDIDHLIRFIDLNRLRLSDKTSVNLKLSGDFSSVTIASLLLLPFLENAFKYGVSNIEESPIDIRVDLSDHTLRFSCVNRSFSARKTTPKHGIGIENTRNRLSILYPERYQLQVGPSGEHFCVHLSVDLAAVHEPFNDQSGLEAGVSIVAPLTPLP